MSAGVDVDAVVVGAGFGGLYMLHKLRGEGFSVQGFEVAPDVGGTWYWNRYPGARCDVESIDYSFGFDEALQQEWTWTERFATQPEILRYLDHVADRFDLRPLIRFGTRVTAATWSEEARNWHVVTDAGDSLSARFVVMATGALSAAKLPDISGLDSFAGRLLSTSAWPHEGVDFAGQRVGVIGTGSSGIQAIPRIAGEAAHLTVFQRTPSFTIPARNAPLAPETMTELKARYADHRRSVKGTLQGVHYRSTRKAAAETSEADRLAAYEDAWAHGGPGFSHTFVDLFVDPAANETAADFVRGKIRAIVKNAETAEALSPRDYPIGSRRIAVDTDYFETFNRPNVTLKDLRRTPIEAIVPEGVRLSDGEVVALDALVLAIGFDAITGSYLRIDMRNAAGESLRDKWAAGPLTYLGIACAGFPNLFLIAGPGGPSVLSNVVLSIEQHVEMIADLLLAMRASGATRAEAGEAAEAGWVDRVNRAAEKTVFMSGDSWYLGANIPGKPRVFMPYVGGVAQYRRICEDMIANDFAGFELS